MMIKRTINEDLKNANLNVSLIDSSIVEFIHHVMNNRGFNARRSCTKDPEIVRNIEYLHSLFPNAKFIYMIRDGRAAAYSLMVQLKENLTWRKYRAYLSTWNQFNKDVTRQCDNVGQEFCLIVKYEDLCLHPKSTLERVIQFLNENWSDKLLNHQNFIGSDIIVSKTEWSSHQIVNFSHFFCFFIYLIIFKLFSR